MEFFEGMGLLEWCAVIIVIQLFWVLVQLDRLMDAYHETIIWQRETRESTKYSERVRAEAVNEIIEELRMLRSSLTS